eukprot:SM000181S03545  [mRNA]  locus=s181:164316:166881:+ [translate_table: standard]
MTGSPRCADPVADGGVGGNADGGRFRVAYDKLVIATGATGSTFGIAGVEQHATQLRDVGHAMAIRRRLLLNLARCEIPGVSEEEKRRLLHCVVVGGGPTGVEFAGELSDFIGGDVKRKFAHVKGYIKVTLIEANEILSSFDVRLRDYATQQLSRACPPPSLLPPFPPSLVQSGVELVHGMVKEVRPDQLTLTDGGEVPYGLLVWSTGVGPSPLVQSLALPKSPGGRVGVDEFLRVPSAPDVYSIGDCAGYLEETGRPVLPALAQVAERQGQYLSKSLNRLAQLDVALARAQAEPVNVPEIKPFQYRHLGSMANVGRYKALAGKGVSLKGFGSWLIWRSAYLTRIISWRNRFYVAINWATTLLFGRDISRI